jgi:hypothetical protein
VPCEGRGALPGAEGNRRILPVVACRSKSDEAPVEYESTLGRGDGAPLSYGSGSGIGIGMLIDEDGDEGVGGSRRTPPGDGRWDPCVRTEYPSSSKKVNTWSI